jgi:glyoxylase-like metal-dependent hydrolase (beta-lactamase superfamily II)
MSSVELLHQYNVGDLLAVPPVIKVIEHLGRNPDVRIIEDLNFTYDREMFVPYIESIKSVRQMMPLSHTLPPATRTNAFLIGDNGPKILIDPSPKDEDEYQKLKNTINQFGLDKIFLTHHHPDHHEQSVRLANDFNIPIMMSLDTYQRLTIKYPNYFNQVEIQIAKEGDVVTDWLGRAVTVYSVPGHDEGQLALAPQDMSWFIAGDLFQGVGTVVIGDDEGDMSKYFLTLERVISLAPKVLFPSHGIGLGGVNILEVTLEHRRLREKQVLQFYREGLSEYQILEKIYGKVDQVLWPFALKNIQKHLEKLKAEKVI